MPELLDLLLAGRLGHLEDQRGLPETKVLRRDIAIQEDVDAWTHRQRQTERDGDRETERQSERQTDRETDRQKYLYNIYAYTHTYPTVMRGVYVCMCVRVRGPF